jgi:hypothetical protein
MACGSVNTQRQQGTPAQRACSVRLRQVPRRDSPEPSGAGYGSDRIAVGLLSCGLQSSGLARQRGVGYCAGTARSRDGSTRDGSDKRGGVQPWDSHRTQWAARQPERVARTGKGNEGQCCGSALVRGELRGRRIAESRSGVARRSSAAARTGCAVFGPVTARRGTAVNRSVAA